MTRTVLGISWTTRWNFNVFSRNAALVAQKISLLNNTYSTCSMPRQLWSHVKPSPIGIFPQSSTGHRQTVLQNDYHLGKSWQDIPRTYQGQANPWPEAGSHKNLADKFQLVSVLKVTVDRLWKIRQSNREWTQKQSGSLEFVRWLVQAWKPCKNTPVQNMVFHGFPLWPGLLQKAAFSAHALWFGMPIACLVACL